MDHGEELLLQKLLGFDLEQYRDSRDLKISRYYVNERDFKREVDTWNEK